MKTLFLSLTIMASLVGLNSVSFAAEEKKAEMKHECKHCKECDMSKHDCKKMHKKYHHENCKENCKHHHADKKEDMNHKMEDHKEDKKDVKEEVKK